MNEQDDQKQEGKEQDFSELAKHARPPEPEKGEGSPFLRGCGIVIGVVAVIFFFIFGACFIQFSR